MVNFRKHKAKTRKAFTLVEMVLSLFIAGVIMTGVSTFMVNTTNILSSLESGSSLDAHIDGVENFFTRTFAKTTVSKALPPQSFSANYSDNVISFSVDEDVPPYISRRGFSPEKTAYLLFKEDEGLFLVWHFKQNENMRGVSTNYPIYETCLSKYVTRIEYVYIDSDGKWNYEEDMEDVQFSSMNPNFIKLYFKKGNSVIERFVRLKNNRSEFFEWANSNSEQTEASRGRTANPNNNTFIARIFKNVC